MKYTFHPHARKELNEAVAYYGSSNPEVGKSFLIGDIQNGISDPEFSRGLCEDSRRYQTLPSSRISLRSGL